LKAKNKQTALIERLMKDALEVKSAFQEGVQSRRSGSAETPSMRHEEPIQSARNSQSIAHESEIQCSIQCAFLENIKGAHQRP